MKNYLAAILLSVLVAGCQTASSNRTQASPSFGASDQQRQQAEINFKNPDQKSWQASLDRASDRPYAQVFVCKGPACPQKTQVLYQPIHLTKPITVDCGCAQAIAENIVKSYPQESRFIIKAPQTGQHQSFQSLNFGWFMLQGESPIYVYALWIFTEKTAVVLEGRSTDFSLSKKAVEHFLTMIEINKKNTKNSGV